MATGSKRRLPYHLRLFLLFLVFAGVLVACFMGFQYGREKHFKAEQLDARLQLFNLRLLDALDEGRTPEEFIAAHRGPFSELRVTVISPEGRVLFDSSLDSLPDENHLARPEVARARREGTGYTIRRHSASTDRTYFYSAMQGAGRIVRTAVPYSVTLGGVLAADRGFLYFMSAVALLIAAAGYIATHRLGRNITRLSEFAHRAERGERIADEEPFPHDELGDISNHIIRLYARLQQASSDRDREHAQALFEEQEKIRIKKQLTNNINHELKTPVAAIQGYLETLAANPGLDTPRREEFLCKSLAQADRLRRLLADVSTITRMDEASEVILKEPLALDEIAAEAAADLELRPEGERLRVHCSLPHPLPMVGSASLLASLFRNLLDNAAAYSGGRDVFIRLEEEHDEEYVLSFADNGIGVSEEHLPRIFERFYRIDKGRSRKLGGTGLGLAIVRNAVMIHGGTITARNRPEGGLEFRFSLRKHSS